MTIGNIYIWLCYYIKNTIKVHILSIRVKLILFISFLFISAIGNVIYTFQLEKYGEEKLFWVNHTNDVLLETKDLLGNIKDMETGQS